MTKKSALSSIKLTKEFSKKKFKSFAHFSAECIMHDLMDRREIKWILGEIKISNPSCFKDIKKTWQYIIEECFNDFVKGDAS